MDIADQLTKANARIERLTTGGEGYCKIEHYNKLQAELAAKNIEARKHEAIAEGCKRTIANYVRIESDHSKEIAEYTKKIVDQKEIIDGKIKAGLK